MQTKTAPPAPIELEDDSKLSDEAVRRELSQILASKTFKPVERLQRFLAFVVEETLAGRSDVLKEYPIGVDVFSKDSDFDPRMDPIVRVQARRLRIRLTAYYRDEGISDEVVIELPKGGYTPTFHHSERLVPKTPVTASTVGRNTVLVIPFEDDSAAHDQTYFCRGLAQEIVHALSKDNSIILVSLDYAADRREAEPMLAALMVTGSVRKSRDVMRIAIQLNDTVHGYLIWSHSIDRNLNDVFAIQEEVAAAVLRALRAQLSGGIDKKNFGRQTENLVAHNMYAQGRYHLAQRTEQGLRRAIDFFSRAITEAPHFAQGYSGLADAYNLLAHYGASAPADSWTKAAANAAQAVMLDDESPEAHTSFAHMKSTQDWDWEASEREFKRAISLDSRYAPAHHWYGVTCLAPLGRLDEALDEVLLAQSLDPTSSIIARDLALIHYYNRNFELALEQCDRTIEQNPHFSPAYWTLGLVQEQRGDLDESVAAFQRAIELSPPSPRIRGALGWSFARAGRRQQALQILRELDELAKSRYISPFELALIYFALDRKDEGFECLTKCYQDRCVEVISIGGDPRFDSLRHDERFLTLFRQLGVP